MITVSPPEVASLPRGLSAQSLLGKHLTPAVWQALKDVKTGLGVTLQDCIASGLAHSDSAIGVYAGDAESLERFGLLFAPLIADLHSSTPALQGLGSDPQDKGLALFNPDPQGTFIRSTRIRLARNLSGYRLMPAIGQRELLLVQTLLADALGSFAQDLAGNYRALDACKGDATGMALSAGFDGADRFQLAAGICRHWPQGRGVFANQSRSLQVWVNEEDHLRIISMQDGADLAAVYARLLRACRQLERALHFQWSERYGYLTACPSNLGTGLRASFHIHLPLSGGSAEFQALCQRHGLEMRSAAGESGMHRGTVYDISNRRRFGTSPINCMQQLLVGTTKLIELERLRQRQSAV